MPIHVLDKHGEKASLRAQAGSTGLHILFFLVLIYVMGHPTSKLHQGIELRSFSRPTLQYKPPKDVHHGTIASLGPAGSGGDHNPLPPTAGNLAPFSKIVLAAPRLPDDRQHLLPVHQRNMVYEGKMRAFWTDLTFV